MDNEPENDLAQLKLKLRSYTEAEIEFNEPHFSQQLALREGNREELIKIILNPEKLVYFYCENGKYGDTIHCLHFDLSNTRTIRLPVIFDKNGKKSLYREMR